MKMLIACISSFALGCATFYMIHQKQRAKNEYVKVLKNALLSLALNVVSFNDIDMLNTSYNKFDGSKLPMMSGADAINACSSYILNKTEFKKDPWYTQIMMDKLVAIDKYLDRHFTCAKDVDVFFTKFMESLQK